MYKILLGCVCLIFYLITAWLQYAILGPGADFKQIVHIVTTTAAFSVLLTAAMQAVCLRMQEVFLRQHKENAWTKWFPSLEEMERILFFWVTLGFILLSLVLISSVYLFPDLLHEPLLQKTLLVLITWAIFGILLAGRYFFGWRGRRIVYYTFLGFILLIIIYLRVYTQNS